MGWFVIVAGIKIVEGSKSVKPGILANDFTIEDGVVRENTGLSFKRKGKPVKGVQLS